MTDKQESAAAAADDTEIEDARKRNRERKARSFNFGEIFEETLNVATERSQQALAAQLQKLNDEDVGPPLALMQGPSTSAAEDDEDEIGPPIPQGFARRDSDEEANAEEQSDEAAVETVEKRLPISHEIVLKHGTRAVSAMAIDTAGARLLSGGYDYQLKFWDFGGMDSSFQPFRSSEPWENYIISALAYTHTGDTILVCTGNAQAKLLNRDGREIGVCVRGDQYIVDMANTKGHIAQLNDGCFHPKAKNEFLTASNDGSMRVWDVNSFARGHYAVIRLKGEGGRKTYPTTCTYSRDGKLVIAGCADGSVQLWAHSDRNFYVNTCGKNMHAHGTGDITRVVCSYDDRTLLSRSMDGSLRAWDLRKLKTPLNERLALDCLFPTTDCLFSPDDKMVITGTSARKAGDGEGSFGKLVFLDRLTFDTVYELTFPKRSVVRTLWHPRLNQIMVGLSDGDVKVLYDPQRSARGAMLCVVKPRKRERTADFVSAQRVITPYSLKAYKEDRERSVKTLLRLARTDPVKSRKPEMPVSGPSTGGRIAATGGTLHSFVAQQLGLSKQINDQQDPRAALLAFAEGDKNPEWTKAYAKNQPKTILASSVEEEKEEKELQPVFKKKKVDTTDS